VRSVLVARWAAPPDSRDRLLRELHQRLRAGESAPAALNAAQAAVRANPDTAAPVHWAGWMLLGAPR